MLFNLLASEASNSSSAAPAGNSWMSWVLIIGLVLVIVVFMVLNSRSSKKRQKETQAMLDAIQPGNKVKTIGGICGPRTTPLSSKRARKPAANPTSNLINRPYIRRTR